MKINVTFPVYSIPTISCRRSLVQFWVVQIGHMAKEHPIRRTKYNSDFKGDEDRPNAPLDLSEHSSQSNVQYHPSK